MNMDRYNYADKKNRHLENKKDIEARIGPGAYINPKLHSEFRPENKPEYLQFFGSTEERFKGNLGAPTGVNPGFTGNGKNVTDPLNTGEGALPGPGTYDPNKDVQGGHNPLRKVATAAF